MIPSASAASSTYSDADLEYWMTRQAAPTSMPTTASPRQRIGACKKFRLKADMASTGARTRTAHSRR